MNLSPHFTLEEFTLSTTASQRGINNKPGPEIVAELTRLAQTMEEVRLALGAKPIVITSGYRCPALNAAVGGVADSAHLYGRACDFIVPGFGSPLLVCQALDLVIEELELDQLIHEYRDWVHL